MSGPWSESGFNLLRINPYRTHWASKIVQPIEVETLACRPDNLNLIPRSHRMAGEDWLLRMILWPPPNTHDMHMLVHMHTHLHIKGPLLPSNLSVVGKPVDLGAGLNCIIIGLCDQESQKCPALCECRLAAHICVCSPAYTVEARDVCR